MRRPLALVLIALGLAATTLTGCNGNTNAADNCSLVLQGAAQNGTIPNVGWALYDAAYVDWPGDGSPYTYNCRGITLAYGGYYVRFVIHDGDTTYGGGDGTYAIPLGPVYEQTWYPLNNHAVLCQGHQVPLHLGEDCGDHGYS